MKTFQIIKSKFTPQDTVVADRLIKNRVRCAIDEMCQKYLRTSDDELTFEALPSALDSTISVLSEKQLSSKYGYAQVSDTMFTMWLKDLDLD